MGCVDSREGCGGGIRGCLGEVDGGGVEQQGVILEKDVVGDESCCRLLVRLPGCDLEKRWLEKVVSKGG